jgi:hypothetical protein
MKSARLPLDIHAVPSAVQHASIAKLTPRPYPTFYVGAVAVEGTSLSDIFFNFGQYDLKRMVSSFYRNTLQFFA